MLRIVGVRITLLNKILETETRLALFALYIIGAYKAWHKWQLIGPINLYIYIYIYIYIFIPSSKTIHYFF